MYGAAGQERVIRLEGKEIIGLGNCLDVTNEGKRGVMYDPNRSSTLVQSRSSDELLKRK